MYNHAFSGSKANSGAEQKVDSGVIINGGTIASSRNVAKTPAEILERPLSIGSRVADITGVDKALSTGTFAKMTAGSYVMRRVTTTLAGVANTSLLTGGSDFGYRRGVNANLTVRFTKLATYSGLTGAATYTDYDYTLTDDAASPTRAIPGEFTIKEHGGDPVNKDYPAKVD